MTDAHAKTAEEVPEQAIEELKSVHWGDHDNIPDVPSRKPHDRRFVFRSPDGSGTVVVMDMSGIDMARVHVVRNVDPSVELNLSSG